MKIFRLLSDFRFFCNSQDHSWDQCKSAKKIFKGRGGGLESLLKVHLDSGCRYGASDFQSVKVFCLCVTLIGWLFSPQMWKILGSCGLRAWKSPAWRLYALFRFFCKSLFSSLDMLVAYGYGTIYIRPFILCRFLIMDLWQRCTWICLFTAKHEGSTKWRME